MSSISERAIAPREMPERDRPISELFRIAGDSWVAAKKKRDLLKGLKDTFLERRKRQLIEDARDAGERMSKVDAESIVKCSDEWEKYIEGLVEAEEVTESAWVKCQELEMRYGEWQSAEANARKERQMGRQAT